MTTCNISKSQLDINESEKSCKTTKAEYELLISSLNCLEDSCFSIVDAKGNMVFISKEFENIDGYKINDIYGKNVLDVYKLGEKNSVHMKAIKEKRVLKNTLLRYTSADGRLIKLIMDIYPIHSGNKIIGSVAVSFDKSKTQSLTDKLVLLQNTLNNQLKKTNSNGTQFQFDDIIGSSQCMQDVIYTAKKWRAQNHE